MCGIKALTDAPYPGAENGPGGRAGRRRRKKKKKKSAGLGVCVLTGQPGM